MFSREQIYLSDHLVEIQFHHAESEVFTKPVLVERNKPSYTVKTCLQYKHNNFLSVNSTIQTDGGSAALRWSRLLRSAERLLIAATHSLPLTSEVHHSGDQGTHNPDCHCGRLDYLSDFLSASAFFS